MKYRQASINDLAISEADRLFRWPLGIRPIALPGLDEQSACNLRPHGRISISYFVPLTHGGISSNRHTFLKDNSVL